MQQSLNKEKPGVTANLKIDYIAHCSCYDIRQMFKIQVNITYKCMCISLQSKLVDNCDILPRSYEFKQFFRKYHSRVFHTQFSA